MENKAVLRLAEKTLSEKGNQPLKEKKTWISPCKVCAIRSNNANVVNTLKNFEGEHDEEFNKTVNRLEWDSEVSLSVEYLKIVLEFLKSCKAENEGGVRIRFNSNETYPVCFEVNENAFGTTQIIIAPRVGAD